MESKNFKSVAFGGFDKEEVISYIRQTAQEHAAAQEALEKENGDLRAELDTLKTERDTLKTELEHLRSEQERSAKEEAERLRKDQERLEKEVEALRPDAEAYRKISASVGDIECQARKRACDLQTTTVEQLESLTAAVRRQYQTLTGALNVAAEHVTAELRNVEVNLTQMPRVLDQAGVELRALEETLRGQQGALQETENE